MLLCKLHNEVFAVAETRINTKCSLTVCEGVSTRETRRLKNGGFPHCM